MNVQLKLEERKKLDDFRLKLEERIRLDDIRVREEIAKSDLEAMRIDRDRINNYRTQSAQMDALFVLLCPIIIVYGSIVLVMDLCKWFKNKIKSFLFNDKEISQT